MFRDQNAGGTITSLPELNNGITRRGFLKLTAAGAASFLLWPFGNNSANKQTKFPENLVLKEAVDTPPSLMLHSASYPLMKDLVPLIKDEYTFLTYRSYYESLVNGVKFSKPPFLISVDDLSPVYMNPNFYDMISLMQENGITGTLGVVTEDKEKWKDRYLDQLRIFSKNGWELAIHAKRHFNLPSLSDNVLEKEIGDCWRDLEKISGTKPITLILPFGDYWLGKENLEIDRRIDKVSRNYGIVWIVGIRGGKQFRDSPPYYVGRIGPGNTSSDTLILLENSFTQRAEYVLPQRKIPAFTGMTGR